MANIEHGTMVEVPSSEDRSEKYMETEYIESMWLLGYQNARAGKSNPYSPGENHDLWATGARMYTEGFNVFAKVPS